MENQVEVVEGTAAGEISAPVTLQPRKAIEYPKEKIPGSLVVNSDMTELELDNLREKYGIPQTVELVIPSSDWKACSPPIGYGVVYRGQLEAGFRLPAHRFWAQLVGYYHLSLAQLTPSAIFCVVHFLVGCAKGGVNPTIDLFRYYFQVKKSPKDCGFMTVNSRKNREFRVKNPDKFRKWKTKYFFFKPLDGEDTLCEEWCSKDTLDSWGEKDKVPLGVEELARLGAQEGFFTEDELSSYGLSTAPHESVAKGIPTQKKKKKGRCYL